MKTKTLLTTCTLAAFLAACNNEDFMTEQTINGPVAENGEVIGADLVSKGMTIYLEEGSADTRAVKGSWKKGDQFGLGWFRFDGSSIVDAQTSTVWNKGANSWQQDDYIYANHIFTAQEDAANTPWETTTDVYQGGYFAYFPYESLGGVKKKVIEVNKAPQTGTFEEERWNKALHLSALEYIAAGAGTENNGTLSVSMSPVPMVNVLYTKANPEASIKNDEILKGMTITSMQINAGGSNNSVFATEATLVPRYIPRRLTTATNEETRQAMFEAADNSTKEDGSNKMLTKIKYSSSITTSVENGSNLDQDREIRAFALPTKALVIYAANQYPTATVTVGRPGKYELGKFAININNSESYITNLKTALSDKDDKACLTKVLRSETGSWATVKTGMDANLILANFTLTSNSIQSLEQWNDLVTVCNALKANGYKFTNDEVKFNVTNEVVFDKEETIQVPEGLKVIVSTSSKGQLTIANTVTWPATLVGAADGKAKVVVNNGATLVFDPQNPAEINATITNNGEIHAGALASICTSTNKNLTNKNRIVIEYGAYVYPMTGEEGVIAYRMEEDNDVAKINKLMLPTAAAENKGIASINTLIIPQGITLNLDAKITDLGDEGDRYEQDDQTINEPLEDLANITIELEGGTIENRVYGETGEHNTVKAVIAKEGATSKMIDVQTSNITIEKGTLTIDAVTYPQTGKHPLKNVKTISNQAGTKLNVATTVHADMVENFGSIDVEAPYTLFYGTLQQVNGDGDRGSTVGNVKPEPVDPTPSYDELTQAVIDSFNSVGFAAAKITTYQGVVDNIHVHGASGKQAEFVEALNTWRASKYLEEVTYDAIDVDDLKQFESISGYKFDLN